MQLVEVAPDVSLAVWRSGPEEGLPYLLVHGLASNAHLWDGVARELADAGHPVAAVDLRGHGRSSKPDGPYDVATVAADLVPLLDALGFDEVVLAGQSYGAIVVLELARLLGARVRRVVCVDGGHLNLQARWPDWEECAELLAPPRTAGAALSSVQGWIRDAHPDWPAEGIAGALACFEVLGDGTVAPWLTFDNHLRVLRGLWECDTSALRRSVTQPVVLLTADDGHGTVRGDLDAAAAELGDGEVVLMVGDHDLHAQHPAAVARVLLASPATRAG
jgi:pimeloyl-ACP methyl ester carboxylesterase